MVTDKITQLLEGHRELSKQARALCDMLLAVREFADRLPDLASLSDAAVDAQDRLLFRDTAPTQPELRQAAAAGNLAARAAIRSALLKILDGAPLTRDPLSRTEQPGRPT